jgi:hypothetical protein
LASIENLSFCESVHATGESPWHLRRLTSSGRKLRGDVDTDSLCGLVESPDGWDVDVAVTASNVVTACPRCLLALRKS